MVEENIVAASEQVEVSEPVAEDKGYSLEDAVNDSFSSQEKEVDESRISTEKLEEEESESEPVVELEAEKPIQPVEQTKDKELDKPPEYDEETRQAREFYARMKDPEYQKTVYEHLQKQYGQQDLVSVTKTPDQIKREEVLNSLDPDIKEALLGMVQQEVSSLRTAFDEYKQTQEHRVQAEQAAKLKDEINSFIESNKDLVKKYEPQMAEIVKQYPGMLSTKAGRDNLLKLVAHDDLVAAKVAEEVEKALNRVHKVEDGVKRFSSSHTPSSTNSTKTKINYSLMDAFEDSLTKGKEKI